MDFNNDSQGYTFDGSSNVNPVPQTSNNVDPVPQTSNNVDPVPQSSNNGASYQTANSENGNQNLGEPNSQEQKKSSGYAIASLVLGILSLVMICCCFCFPMLNFVLGVLAIIFAIIDRKRPDRTGASIGGLVCGILGVILSIILLIFPKICVKVMKDELVKKGYNVEEILEELNLDDFSFDNFDFKNFNVEQFLKMLEEKFGEQ